MAECSLDGPGTNWVQEAGGLPPYIHSIACALIENGHSKSSAIAIAISRVKVWAATGSAETKAKAAAALAEWEAKRAKAKAKRGTDMAFETRAAVGSITPVDDPDKRLFAARVLNYGPVDDHGTSWAPGVFADSLRAKLPKAVWSHDAKRPIGHVTDYRDTPEGLDVIVQLDDFEAVPDSRMTHALLKSGTIDEFSFAFTREDDEDDPNNRGAVRITKAKMHEVSPVLVASGQGTRTLGVRSATRAEATDLLNQVAMGEITAQDALEQLAETRDTVTIPTTEYRSLMDKAGIKPERSADCCIDTSSEFRAIEDLFSEDWD